MMKITPDLQTVESKFYEILVALNLDVSDENLEGTPERLAKMYVNELFKGVYNDLPEFVTFPKKGDTFIYTKVPFNSTCAHHFQPIKGVAHVMVDYTHAERVLGLSKFNRIVEHFAAKPTLQEDLTFEVHSYLSKLLSIDEVYVGVEATHHCVTDRGVCAAFSNTFTEIYSNTSVDFQKTCRSHLDKEGV